MEQFDRVRRMLNRIENNVGRSVSDYGDDVWSFFQNCWHLKDWIKNDPHVSIHGSIEDLVKGSAPLMICADLANATKHLQFTKYVRVGAKPSHANITITPGEPSTVQYLVDPGTGAQLDALDLARHCVSEWERLLAAHGVATL
jgi:hypothetical protein